MCLEEIVIRFYPLRGWCDDFSYSICALVWYFCFYSLLWLQLIGWSFDGLAWVKKRLILVMFCSSQACGAITLAL